MERLCFLSPDLAHAKKVVSDLKGHGVSEKSIYALARHGVELDDLPDEGPESDDFLPAYERGLAVGGTTCLLAGLTALAFPPAGIVVGGGLVLLVGLWGAGLGGILAGIAGAAYASSRLENFEAALDQGQILLLVDVEKRKVGEVEALVRTLDPEISIEGVEPPMKLIP